MEENTSGVSTDEPVPPRSTVVGSMTRTRGRHAGGPTSELLPAPADARERLIALFRERDALDARGYADGSQRMRGTIWANAVARLESGAESYEAYGVIAAAGVELPREALQMVASLPQGWNKICRVDPEGRLWTASVSEKKKQVR